MNQPAPDWQPTRALPAAPAPAAPLAEAIPAMPTPVAYEPQMAAPAVMAPPAPPADAVPAMGFAIPTDAASMLDVTAPLQAVPQQQVVHEQPQAAAPAAAPAHVQLAEYPTSLAMPTTMPDEQVNVGPMPVEPSFQPLAAVPDLAPDAAPADAVDPTGQWWSPGVALVVAVAALALQFVAFYARVQLPLVESSGTPLSNFDSVVGSFPLIDGIAGQFLGMVLAGVALGMVLYGSRRGLREPGLQGLVGGIAAVALLMTVALPKLAG